jgi:hypothetical protein
MTIEADVKEDYISNFTINAPWRDEYRGLLHTVGQMLKSRSPGSFKQETDTPFDNLWANFWTQTNKQPLLMLHAVIRDSLESISS